MEPRPSSTTASVEGSLIGAVRSQALTLAFLVALAATVGSLFLSEVAGLVPCHLCWYQRIAMFPLVVMLAIAAWRHDLRVRPYALPLVGIGFALAVYHYLVQWFPSLETRGCRAATPCATAWVWQLGYISIPLMAATAFALIGVLLALADAANPDQEKTE